MWETKVGKSLSEARPRQKHRIILKKYSKKELGA
jgi:hypothetical protein